MTTYAAPSRLTLHLRLGRVSNLPTVWTNVLAGAVLGGGALRRYVDLGDALADPAPADEWRIHFHVPIFREALGRFASTQPFLADVVAARMSTHLEVETYTWDVLPAEFRAEPIEDAIARELSWVKERLA